MSLLFIKTQRSSYVVDTVNNNDRQRLHIIYGRCARLFCKTIKNKTGISYSYSDFCSQNPIQVCFENDVTDKRSPNQEELKIYQTLASGRKLSKNDKSYLKNNCLEQWWLYKSKPTANALVLSN